MKLAPLLLKMTRCVSATGMPEREQRAQLLWIRAPNRDAKAVHLPQIAAEMAALVGKGVNSFKFFFGYKGALAVSDELFLQGLLRCKELGALPMVLTLPL